MPSSLNPKPLSTGANLQKRSQRNRLSPGASSKPHAGQQASTVATRKESSFAASVCFVLAIACPGVAAVLGFGVGVCLALLFAMVLLNVALIVASELANQGQEQQALPAVLANPVPPPYTSQPDPQKITATKNSKQCASRPCKAGSGFFPPPPPPNYDSDGADNFDPDAVVYPPPPEYR